MRLPETQRVEFETNPLAEVICQLRFPTILEISTAEPAEFQRRIRKDYPLYQTEAPEPGLPHEITEMIKRVGLSQPRTTHKFLSEDQAATISLHPDFLAISTSSYTRWAHFRGEIKRALTALSEIYEPAFYQRVGLRYINIVWPNELDVEYESWRDLIKPQLLGVLGMEEFEGSMTEVRTVSSIDVSQVEATRLALRHGLIQKDGTKDQGYTIDADFFTTRKVDGNHALERLDEFNRYVGNLFRLAITDRLRNALGPRPVADEAASI